MSLSTSWDKNGKLISSILSSTIIRRWRDEFGIDVDRFFIGLEFIDLRRHERTGLEYFFPQICGDEALYQALQTIPWYYLSEKWEYERALRDIYSKSNILEVGCGSGAFLKKAAAGSNICVGLELNSSAVAAASQAGLNVQRQMLSDFLITNTLKFDRVFSFQLLEHVMDPVAMIRDMMSCVKDGGRVCFAVPNARSLLNLGESILDMPPHHLTRWQPEAIKRIGHLVGARDVIIEEGPLERVHIDWFLSIVNSKLPSGRILVNRLSRGFIRQLLGGRFGRVVRGHSVYAEFVK